MDLIATNKLPYEQQRCYFLLKTAGLRIILRNLRKRYKLSRIKTSKDWNVFFMAKAESGEFITNFNKVLATIQTNNYFLENAIAGTYEKDVLPSLDSSLPLHIGYKFKNLGEGFFVRIGPKTRLETVRLTYKYIKSLYKKMDTLDGYIGRKIDVNVKNKKLDLETHYPIFKVAEETILNTFRKKGVEDNRELGRIITSAIDYAGEEAWGRSEFKKAEVLYYKFLDYYGLPRFQQFKNLFTKLRI